jgi:hypothetical protein
VIGGQPDFGRNLVKMIRVVSCLAVVLVCSAAQGAMMVHYDLAGLAMNSQAIVIADRGAPDANPERTHYRVVHVLRGEITTGTDLVLDDGLYRQRGHAYDGRVVLWLTKVGEVWAINSSGMRVVENGKVFRFEQMSNPGGWNPVPQGSDPQDMWHWGTPQLDMAGLERAIAAAGKRVDALEAARAEPDRGARRAKLLAVMAPLGAARAHGFYVDVLVGEGLRILAESGDLEGALLVAARDHGSLGSYRPFGSLTELVAFASDGSKPAPLRVLAIDAIARRGDFLLDVAAAHAMLALFQDANPRIRAAAVRAAARPANASSSDPADNRRLKQLAAQARAEVRKLYEREQNATVLYAIAEVRPQGQLPPHRGLPLGAQLSVDSGGIAVEVLCLDPQTRIKSVALYDASGELPHYRISAGCGADGLSGGNGTMPAPLAAGVHELRAEVRSGRKVITVPLGSASADPDGEVIVSP